MFGRSWQPDYNRPVKPTLIIVDDVKAVRDRLHGDLEAHFRVLAQAKNGLEAVQKVKDHRPDLVLMDVSMPQSSGLEALDRMRADSQPPQTIILSAVRNSSWVWRAFQSGASDYLLKPASTQSIIQTLMRAYVEQKNRSWRYPAKELTKA